MADITDAEEADPTSGPHNNPNHQLLLSLHQCSDSQLWCGTVYNIRFSHMDGNSKLEDNLLNFTTEKKQVNLTDCFYVKVQ